MSTSVKYVNPAGNITAIVSGADISHRLEISRKILSSAKAEQVAFECAARLSQDSSCLGRIEMMGGEFCGNATRAYGYLKALELYKKGCHDITIEISGLSAPVKVEVDLDKKEAYTDMPLPVSMDEIEIDGRKYPVVRTEGIDHVIIVGQVADEALAMRVIAGVKAKWNSEAVGVMFLEEGQGCRTKLTPFVHVCAVDSYVWESSCGSGSVACGWFLAMQDETLCGCELVQPGGIISVKLCRTDGKVCGCLMGGKVSIIAE